ncbi:MAG: hypothetical protein UT33_C0018G0015 [Candidatus Peregrinibacteria bacterium GW2011_GWC2_39_14]|nr:MAG: hypothetical protein US92_C0003G0014 [Candidatus Peregrinibacteria bacterium GW2011_GWA2_38_36]KKR04663.1 MAG: hypothetical protein UT33_C0018G0015 [Candidatus Peregrinibacteria bacterium GW2011_GWC2_39_14]
MNKKIVIGIVAALLIGVGVFLFTSSGGGLFKGSAIGLADCPKNVKLLQVLVQAKNKVNSKIGYDNMKKAGCVIDAATESAYQSLLNPTETTTAAVAPSITCTDESKKFEKVQSAFNASMDYTTAKAFLSDYENLMTSEAVNINKCGDPRNASINALRDSLNAQYKTMQTRITSADKLSVIAQKGLSTPNWDNIHSGNSYIGVELGKFVFDASGSTSKFIKLENLTIKDTPSNGAKPSDIKNFKIMISGKNEITDGLTRTFSVAPNMPVILTLKGDIDQSAEGGTHTFSLDKSAIKVKGITYEAGTGGTTIEKLSLVNIGLSDNATFSKQILPKPNLTVASGDATTSKNVDPTKSYHFELAKFKFSTDSTTPVYLLPTKLNDLAADGAKFSDLYSASCSYCDSLFLVNVSTGKQVGVVRSTGDIQGIGATPSQWLQAITSDKPLVFSLLENGSMKNKSVGSHTFSIGDATVYDNPVGSGPGMKVKLSSTGYTVNVVTPTTP